MSHYRANATAPQFSTALRNIGTCSLRVRGLPRSGCDDTSTSIARITTLHRGISQGRGHALHFCMAAIMQGMTPKVNPASPAHRLDARTSTRSSFARHEFGRCRSTVIAGMRNVRQVQINTKVSDQDPLSDAIKIALRKYNWLKTFWHS